jgi:RecA-family ATPase
MMETKNNPVIPEYVITADKLMSNEITEIPMLVGPIFQKIGIVGFVGSSDTGKSCFLRQLSIEIVAGSKEFIGFPINSTHQSVIYVSTEDDYYSLSALLKKQNISGVHNDKLMNLRIILDTHMIFAKLTAELKRAPADLIIIDAFSDIFTGDLNMSTIVRGFLDKYHQLALKFECLIIFLHHTGKRTELLHPSKNNVVGTQGFEAKMRSVVELRKDPNENVFRHLCITKGNYIPDEAKEKSFKLEFENLLFKNTGESAEFEKLARNSEKEIKLKETAKKRAIELRTIEGKNFDEIFETMSKEYFPYKRATYARWLKGIPPSIDLNSMEKEIDR